MKVVDGTEDLMIITEHGILIRMAIEDISTFGRNTQGVRLIRLDTDETVATVSKVVREPEEDEEMSELEEELEE